MSVQSTWKFYVTETVMGFMSGSTEKTYLHTVLHHSVYYSVRICTPKWRNYKPLLISVTLNNTFFFGGGETLSVKIQGNSYIFDIVESEYETKLPHNPPFLKERVKLRNHVCNKDVMYWFFIIT
jgi:hypothetical protein